MPDLRTRPADPFQAPQICASRAGLSGWLLAVPATAFLGWVLGAAPELGAVAGGSTSDLDGDGLTDIQEVVLGSKVDEADSDGDGLRDLEEIARQLDPLTPDAPTSADLGVGFAVRATGGVFYLTTAVFVPDGDLTNVELELGLYFEGMLFPLSPADYLPLSESFAEGGEGVDSEVVAFSFPIPEFLLQSVGSLGFYATTSPQGVPVTSAAVANLTTAAGVTALRRVTQGPSGPGISILPISPPGDLPSSFTPNEVCFQETVLIGVENNVQLFQVTDAGCVPSTSVCTPGCALTAGGTVQLLDPLALIGG